MDIGKRFRTDKLKEKEGSWITIDGSEFLIARSNNRAYRTLLAETLEKNASALEGGTPEAEALDDKLLGDVMAETILLDWKKVLVDGKNAKYTKALAAKLLTQMPDFCELIRTHASSIDNFRIKHEEAQVKK